MPDVIDNIISFISRDSEGGSDKEILLRGVVKEISQNKYSKFYRAKQGELDLAFAQYFYNIYRTIYPLQVFLSDPVKEAKIKQITLESFLDKNSMDMIRKISPEAIHERRKTAGAALPKQLEEDLAALTKSFDNPKIAAADECYDLIACMKQIVFFDYCSLLKKFDPGVKEGDFLSLPKFTEVDAKLLFSQIKSFLTILPPFEKEYNWKTVFEILKYCKGGTDVIPLDLWNNLLLSLKDLKQSKILEQIGKLAAGNPAWEVKYSVPSNETLSASWLEQKACDIRNEITGITGSQKNAQIKTLLNTVFGTTEMTRLKYFTEERGTLLLQKGLDGYIYAPALNHLYAFIQEYLSREIQELCDILLIRGKWTNNTASRQMSDSYHEAMDIINEINTLDDSLDDDGTNGARLRGALLRVDRDSSQGRYIESIVSSMNEEAINIIHRAVPSLIVVGKHFKMLLDDYDKKPFELIMNWKELNGVSKVSINQRITNAYKKINYFVQLMILETKAED